MENVRRDNAQVFVQRIEPRPSPANASEARGGTMLEGQMEMDGEARSSTWEDIRLEEGEPNEVYVADRVPKSALKQIDNEITSKQIPEIEKHLAKGLTEQVPAKFSLKDLKRKNIEEM